VDRDPYKPVADARRKELRTGMMPWGLVCHCVLYMCFYTAHVDAVQLRVMFVHYVPGISFGNAKMLSRGLSASEGAVSDEVFTSLSIGNSTDMLQLVDPQYCIYVQKSSVCTPPCGSHTYVM
jgi:hypothetical protein